MTALISLLVSSGILKWLGIAVAGVATLGSVWLHGRSSGKTVATAAAQEKINAAVTTADKATQEAATARATVTAVQVVAEARDAAQAIPDSDLDAELAKIGALRAEPKP